jgi:hypothetical protein
LKVYTNIKVLKKVKRLLDQLKLGYLINGNLTDEAPTGMELLNRLLDDDLLVEFLQIITQEPAVDFEEMEPKKIGELIESFFVGIAEYMPESLLQKVKIQLSRQ